MRFDSDAAFHYMLYHDILQWQKGSKGKSDKAPRWYHLKCRLGPLLFSHEGLLLARVDVWNVYDSGPPDHSFPVEDQEPFCCMRGNQTREMIQLKAQSMGALSFGGI